MSQGSQVANLPESQFSSLQNSNKRAVSSGKFADPLLSSSTPMEVDQGTNVGKNPPLGVFTLEKSVPPKINKPNPPTNSTILHKKVPPQALVAPSHLFSVLETLAVLQKDMDFS